MTVLYESPRLQFGLWRLQDLPLARRLWTNRQTCRYITASGAMTPRQAEQRMELEIQQYLQPAALSGQRPGPAGAGNLRNRRPSAARLLARRLRL